MPLGRSLCALVDGAFGARFEQFGDGKLRLIAYGD